MLHPQNVRDSCFYKTLPAPTQNLDKHFAFCNYFPYNSTLSPPKSPHQQASGR